MAVRRLSMSLPMEEELAQLRDYAARHDDETYHSLFDKLIESRLAELDPEWMEAMLKEYHESGMSRWCA